MRIVKPQQLQIQQSQVWLLTWQNKQTNKKQCCVFSRRTRRSGEEAIFPMIFHHFLSVEFADDRFDFSWVTEATSGQINITRPLRTLRSSSFYGHGFRQNFRWPSGLCLHLSKLLITCRKSENYNTSLKCSCAVVKGSVWGWWYSWAQHLESLSSASKRWLKTNVSTTRHPPKHPPTTRTNTPLFQCNSSLSPAAAPDSVYSGRDQLLATARIHSQHTDFCPIFRRSEKFMKPATSNIWKYHLS